MFSRERKNKVIFFKSQSGANFATKNLDKKPGVDTGRRAVRERRKHLHEIRPIVQVKCTGQHRKRPSIHICMTNEIIDKKRH